MLNPLSPRVSNEMFTQTLNDTVDRLMAISATKGHEYSGDNDRLRNFRQLADQLDITKEEVLAVYASKHWMAIMQFVKDVANTGGIPHTAEPIEGRIDDLIVYMLLLKCMVEERRRVEENVSYEVPPTTREDYWSMREDDWDEAVSSLGPKK